jgi:hypothetical protein
MEAQMEIALSAIPRGAQTGPVIPVTTNRRWRGSIQKKAFPTSPPDALTAISTVEEREEKIEKGRKHL